jgi:hypothetical protein
MFWKLGPQMPHQIMQKFMSTPSKRFCSVKRNAKRMILRTRSLNATDVGLEPTASALGGLRATIAPTGQLVDLMKEMDLT